MFKRSVMLLTISLLLLLGLTSTLPTQAGADSEDDPWLQKPILLYLLLTQDARLEREKVALFDELRLSEAEQKALLEIAIAEQQQVQAIYQQSQVIVHDESRSLAEKQDAISRYNADVVNATFDADSAVRQVLGDRYAPFREWIRDWWKREQQAIVQLKQPQEDPSIRSDAYSCSVYATQYSGATDYEVSLPDKYLEYANKGWYIPSPYDARYNNPPYTVNVNRDSAWAWNVMVRKTGPWNADDNYWDAADGANPRRLFEDLPLCWSEAEYAYYNGYNNGKDQFGRTVTVPSSVDLTPGVAADLGLGAQENSWLTVYYSDLP